MNRDEPGGSLADDPLFRDSLAGLDRGLSDPAPVRPAAPAAEPSRGASPGTAPAAPAQPGVVLPPVVSGHGPRPLLELFPPENGARPAAAREPEARQPALTREAFYGFREPPFAIDRDLRLLYQSSALIRASQTMLSAIRRRDGIVLLTGAYGVGKTTLCRSVLEQLDQHTITSIVPPRFSSAEDLLASVLMDFGVMAHAEVPANEPQRAALVVALHDFLATLRPLQALAVVIVDDAHTLSAEHLDHVRALLDAAGEERLLQLVLIGEPPLQETLRRRELRPLAQRIAVRYALEPLAPEDVGAYIVARMSAASTQPGVQFDGDAVRKIADLSGGLPRAINILCDRALSIGFEAWTSEITAPMIARAAVGVDLPRRKNAARRLRAAALALGFLLLAGIGAAAAAIVFQSRLSAALTEWAGRPAPPPAPRLPAAQPYIPPTPSP